MQKENIFFKNIEEVSDLEKVSQIDLAINHVKEEIEAEYHLDQKDVFINYARPKKIEVDAPDSVASFMRNILGNNGFDQKDIEDFIKEKLGEQPKKTRVVPKLSTLKLTSTQAIRVLSFILKLYEEEKEELVSKIKNEL